MPNKINKTPVKPSLEELYGSWYDDTNMQNNKRGRGWMIAALIAMTLCISLTALVMSLFPLKETKIVAFTVDKNTGVVTPITRLDDTVEFTRTKAMTFADASKYIRFRHEYSYYNYAEHYSSAVLMSTGKARLDLIRTGAPDAPTSPMIELQDRSQIDVTFKSIAFLNESDGVITARFKTTSVETDPRNATRPTETHYIATIRYEYVDASELSFKMRLINPLAFVVTDYQVSKDGI